MNGGLGVDTLLGSKGDDLVNGGDGNDTALLGAGDDTFVWNPGDDSDVVEGQAGFDRMLFNGANIAEQIAVSANGGRVRFTRDIAASSWTSTTSRASTSTRSAAPTRSPSTISAGTDVTEVNTDLAAFGGAGDGAADNVIVKGTAGDDVVQVSGDASGVAVVGLAAQVNITGAEAANDRLTVDLLAGDDVLEASGLAAARSS